MAGAAGQMGGFQMGRRITSTVAVMLLACFADPGVVLAGPPAGEATTAPLPGPVTVSSFSAEDLEARQADETLDLARLVPNFVGHRSSGAGNSNAYFLRGLGNAETIATFDPAVGTYIDGVFVSRQSSTNYSLYDVERVDVLRGPQGTAFGHNTTAGAINIVSRKPSTGFNAGAEVGVGNLGRLSGHGTVDYPIDDRWLTRLSGYYEQADGFVRSTVTGEEFNDLEDYGMRGAVRFVASDTLTVDLALENHYRHLLNPVRLCRPAPGGTEPADGCRYGVDPDASGTAFTTNSTGGSHVQQALRGEGMDSYTHSVRILSNVDWKVAGLDVQYILGRIDESWDYTMDFDPTGVPGGQSNFAVTQEQDTYQWSQEVRVTGAAYDGRLNYTGGIFWLDEKNITRFNDISVNEDPANGPVGATWLQIDRHMTNRTDDLAAYFEVAYALTGDLTLTAGGRYTDEDKSIRFDSRDGNRPNDVVLFDISTQELIDGGVPVDQDVGEFTPKLAAEYRWNQDWSLVASATKGFKSGGWNSRGSASAPCFHTPACYQAFDPEYVWSYEAGFRYAPPDHHLRITGTLFNLDVDDLQLATGLPAPDGVLFLTRNAADARFRGAEFDWTWLVSDQVDLYGTLGLMDAEYTSVRQPSLITTGTEPVRAPDVTGSLGATYAWPRHLLGGAFHVGGDLSFTDRHWVSSTNAPAIADVPGAWLLQAQDGYESDDGSWTANLSCRNCTDEEYITSYFIGPYMGDPRTYEFRVGYRVR